MSRMAEWERAQGRTDPGCGRRGRGGEREPGRQPPAPDTAAHPARTPVRKGDPESGSTTGGGAGTGRGGTGLVVIAGATGSMLLSADADSLPREPSAKW